MKCKAITDKFNCGCCEAVILTCDLKENHRSERHECELTDDDHIVYSVAWLRKGEAKQ